jgi:hypothetical protein
LILTLIAGLAGSAALGQETPETAEETSLWEEVVALYERAKQSGEEVPKDVYEWASEDLQSIGDWEYLVIELGSADAQATQDRLNAAGAERWECIWVRQLSTRTQFIMKRPVRSYLQNIPLTTFGNMLGKSVTDGGE